MLINGFRPPMRGFDFSSSCLPFFSSSCSWFSVRASFRVKWGGKIIYVLTWATETNLFRSHEAIIYCLFIYFLLLFMWKLGKLLRRGKLLPGFNDSRKVFLSLIAQFWGFVSGRDVRKFLRRRSWILVARLLWFLWANNRKIGANRRKKVNSMSVIYKALLDKFRSKYICYL